MVAPRMNIVVQAVRPGKPRRPPPLRRTCNFDPSNINHFEALNNNTQTGITRIHTQLHGWKGRGMRRVQSVRRTKEHAPELTDLNWVKVIER